MVEFLLKKGMCSLMVIFIDYWRCHELIKSVKILQKLLWFFPNRNKYSALEATYLHVHKVYYSINKFHNIIDSSILNFYQTNFQFSFKFQRILHFKFLLVVFGERCWCQHTKQRTLDTATCIFWERYCGD